MVQVADLTIVETKLRPPVRAGKLVLRARLLDSLSALDTARLALVSAPAGAGKTTVLAHLHQALESEGTAVAWVSLDPQDNGPQRFFAHLIAAIGKRLAGAAEDAANLLNATPDAPAEQIVSTLINGLLDAGEPVVIFLDDYHEIQEAAIHEAMSFFLRFLPSNATLVVGSRVEPPFPLASLRARGVLIQLGWPDLQFTFAEARQYLREFQRLHLSDDQIRFVNQHTEGWIVALQLAAMSVKERADPERFVEQLSGAQMDVSAYLLENVFLAQPEPIRDFLLRTSILDRISAPLCDALTGGDDARSVLEHLERCQLLIFRLDQERTWYRYHHLFSAFLQARLAAEHPSEMPALHERASRWFEARGRLVEAVHYAVAGGLLDRATALMPALGRELFAGGAFKELLHWLAHIPEEMLQARAELCSLHAWALAYLGELELARSRLVDAHAALAASDMSEPSARRRSIEAELQVLRTAIGVIETDEPDVSDLRPDVAKLIPSDYPAMRGFAHVALGYAARAGGRLTEALDHYRRGAQMAGGGDSSLVHMLAQFNMGTVLYLMGQPRDAETSLCQALALASERGWLRAMGSAFVRVELSVVLYEQNRLREALIENSEALAVLKSTRAFGFMGVGLVERARLLLALGRRGEAMTHLDRALTLARDHGVKRVIFRAHLLVARIALEAGRPEQAEIELAHAEAGLDPEEMTRREPFSEKYETLLIERVKACIHCRRYGEALRMARDGLSSAILAEHGRNKIEFLTLQALAWQGLEQTDKALNKLDQALALADERGFLRMFVDCGRDMGALLQLLLSENRQASVAQRILHAFDEEKGRAGQFGKSRAGSESALHYREEQILKLISLGLRNREIAVRLDLSEETVKWYLKRLYSKLDVKTRTQAVTVAREMAIIS